MLTACSGLPQLTAPCTLEADPEGVHRGRDHLLAGNPLVLVPPHRKTLERAARRWTSPSSTPLYLSMSPLEANSPPPGHLDRALDDYIAHHLTAARNLICS